MVINDIFGLRSIRVKKLQQLLARHACVKLKSPFYLMSHFFTERKHQEESQLRQCLSHVSRMNARPSRMFVIPETKDG